MKASLKWIGVAALSIAAMTAQANYQFSDSIYQGYWVMTDEVMGRYTVVNFRKSADGLILSESLGFVCDAQGNYTPANENEVTQLVPMADKMAMVSLPSRETYAYLQERLIVPQKVLLATQTFTDEMSEIFPEGLTFAYEYRENPVPFCAK